MTVNFRDDLGESPSFQIPTAYSMASGVATPKAYAGQNQKSQYFFYTIEEVNRLKSDKAGYEVKETVEIVEFKNDSKCSPAHRIDASLFSMHPEILSEYQRWKQGKVSDLTEIRSWDALTVGEMGTLIACGFYSVEQVAASTDQELMILGLGWKDIKIKADQHMKKKMRERQGLAEKAELSEVQQELAKRDAQIEEMRAMILALQPKEAKVTLEEDTEAEIKEDKPKKKAGLQSK